MNVAAAAFVLAPALALGSFLDVLIRRVPAGRSVVRPPSSCDACSAQIRRRDNVPLLSYVLLRGRCRDCGARISPLTPAVEAVTAALIAVCVAVLGASFAAALASGVCVVLVVLVGIGLERRR